MQRSRFTQADQEMFAALSGDANPMHMDALAARRTQAGMQVVHGIHALLWAMDCASAQGVALDGLQQLRVQFAKFIPLDTVVTLEISRSGTDTARLVVLVSGLAAIVAMLRFGPREPARAMPQAASPIPQDAMPVARSLEQMPGLSGWLESPADAARFAYAFPHASAGLSPRILSGLAQTSRLVGMVCPGLHSIFAGLALTLTEAPAGADAIFFDVTKADPRFRLVEMAVQGNGLAGKISAFVRQAPVAPPAMADLARRVQPAEFAGVHALIAGGSRGLGALTAMLLAAGGARTTITYARGREDAEQVCAAINESCGESACTMLAYDAMLDAAAQLAQVTAPATQLYYFATTQIFVQKTEGFASDVYGRFSRVYVDAFHECCQALHPRPTSAFYPSSVAVENAPAGMLEYAMAKAAGELLCRGMNAAGWSIVQSRLPRLLTDQTATVAQIDTADPVDVMLPLIRAMAR